MTDQEVRAGLILLGYKSIDTLTAIWILRKDNKQVTYESEYRKVCWVAIDTKKHTHSRHIAFKDVITTLEGDENE